MEGFYGTMDGVYSKYRFSSGSFLLLATSSRGEITSNSRCFNTTIKRKFTNSSVINIWIMLYINWKFCNIERDKGVKVQMRQTKKLLPLMLILVLILVACTSGKSFKAELDYKVSDFSYTNQDNKKVSLKDLKGQPWLAMFIFTNCTTVCPPMTANMTDIQKDFKEAGLEDYKIVGFSVDPTVDTPEKLKAYLANYDVPDASKWSLLTGYSQADIEKFAVDSFKTLVKKTDGNDQVIHGTSFMLVDQEGTVVKSYSGVSDVPKDKILVDMESIIKDGK